MSFATVPLQGRCVGVRRTIAFASWRAGRDVGVAKRRVLRLARRRGFMLVLLAAASAVGAQPATQTRVVEDALLRQQRSLAAVGRAGDVLEQQRLWQAHLQTMAETLQQVQLLRPGGRMSLEQLRDWMAEHQRLMERLMTQMMQEHEFLKREVPCPVK